MSNLQERNPPSSGSEIIDRTRREVAQSPTTAGNFRSRSVQLYLWISAMQQQGAEMRPFQPIDKEYYALEASLVATDRNDESAISAISSKIAGLIDRGFAVAEQVQADLSSGRSLATEFEVDAALPHPVGDLDADWPMFQRDIHHTGWTPAPGPSTGKLAWRFPIGLGTYARPVVEDGRVYVSSLGIHTTSYCLDLGTGAEIWRSTQEHPKFGIYKYPAIASTPLLVGDQVILREVNSHGGNEGQARNLVFLDKQTGRTEARHYAGHVDYRTQNAPVASNGRYLVYPFGVHDIYDAPAICQNFNRLICADATNEKRLWDFNVGDMDALAEPVLTESLAIVGTMEGYLYGLRLEATAHDDIIAWKFRADGAVNTAIVVADGKVFFGANGGTAYCLDAVTGTKVWATSVCSAEPRARKLFTTPFVSGSKILFGTAARQVVALDARSGSILWRTSVSDWVRSAPTIVSDKVFAASVDGKLHVIAKDGTLQTSVEASTHPIYADLVAAGDRLLVQDSNLALHCLDASGANLWTVDTLDAFVDERGHRIFTDELSGGTYYQSKPTAWKGKVFIGTPSGFLHALDADTGREEWKFEMGGAISVGAAVVDGRVFAGQQGGERFFYCLSAEDGSLIWKQTLPGGWVWGSATVDDGMVYVPTVSGYAVCLNAETGHIVWMFPTAKSVPAEPAIDGDLVYFGSWSRSIYAFHKKTGEIVWKTNGIALDSGTLIAYKGRVYLPHHRNIFKYLDGRTGEVLCDGNTSDEDKGPVSDFNATPAFHDGRAYFSARGGIGLRGVPLFSTFYCVDPETARILWKYPDGGGLSAPAIASNRVYIGSGNAPFLHCLDATTGKPLWIYRLGHRVEEATLCIYRDKVYVLSADGYLHAIR